MIGEKFLYQIADEFNKTLPTKKSDDLETVFRKFQKYISTMDIDTFQQFIGAYYKNDKPVVVGISKNHYMTISGKFNSTKAEVGKYVSQFENDPMTCDEIKDMLILLFRDFPKRERYESEIGGPVTIMKISKANVVTFYQNNFPKPKFKNFTEYANKVINGEINITPLQGHTREEIVRIFQSSRYYHFF